MGIIGWVCVSGAIVYLLIGLFFGWMLLMTSRDGITLWPIIKCMFIWPFFVLAGTIK